MATSKTDISQWFDKGRTDGEDFMIIVCDTYDWEDYPIYTKTAEFSDTYEHYNGRSMQKIMEVYNLALDKQVQLGEISAFHYPPDFQK